MSSLDVPQTQSTAPVFEYRCLFTSDLRRKQKRWQDGQLKFHTFNNRVMVYDDRSNFVGDSHWREDELNEGEELQLERRGILVEVGECTGQRNQDLSDLVDKPRKQKEDRAAARAAASPARRDYDTPTGSDFVRPKPLRQMLTPSGHYGRAVLPNISPFEEKQLQSRAMEESGRPLKRRRIVDTPSKSGYAQNLMGASLSLTSSRPSSTAAIRYEPLRLMSAHTPTPGAIIDLTNDNDNDRGFGNLRHNTKALESMPKSTARVQNRKKELNSAKSGYASNLTGAALSLVRPAAVGSIRTIRPHAVRDSPIPDVSGDEGSSISEVVSTADSLMSDRQEILPQSEVSVSKNSIVSSHPKITSNVQSSSPLAVEAVPAGRATRKLFPSPQGGIYGEPKSRGKNDKSRSASPALAASTIPPIEVVSNQTAIRRSSLNETSSATAMSSLRIKSRPSRRMMMLMNRPSSRQHIAPQTTLPRTNVEPAANTLVLSQATLQLDSFRQKQEQRLQARSSGQRPRIIYDDLSSSPPDSGIDHCTIDLLLSRKLEQRSTENSDTPNTYFSANADFMRKSDLVRKAKSIIDIDRNGQQVSNVQHLIEDCQSLSFDRASRKELSIPRSNSREAGTKKLVDPPTITSKQPRSSGTFLLSEHVSHTPNIIADRPTVDAESLLETTRIHAPSFSKASLVEQTSLISRIITQDSARNEQHGLSIVAPENVISRSKEEMAIISSELHVDHPWHGETPPDIRGQTDFTTHVTSKAVSGPSRHILNQVGLIRNRLEDQATHSNGQIQSQVEGEQEENLRSEILSAKEQFNVTTNITPHLIKPIQASLNDARVQRRSYADLAITQSQACDIIQEPSMYPSRASEIDPVSVMLAVKSSPKTTPLDSDMSQGGGALKEGDVSIKEDSVPTSPRPAVGDVALLYGEVPPQTSTLHPPRAKVSNPATRGKSLQTIAANTADTLGTVFNAVMMPPSAQRSLNRINKSNPREVAKTGRAEVAPAREELKSGPWSCESFDLFGAWKPPEKHTSTNVVTS